MSGRGYFLKMREWELDSMKAFVRELETHMDEVYALWFFYSFQIPRLGKEFDLLQIREDQIVNVELKSGAVSDEALRKQLIQNRYYLAVQGKDDPVLYIYQQPEPACPPYEPRPDRGRGLGTALRGSEGWRKGL